MGTQVKFGKQDIKQDKFADSMADVREFLTENKTSVFGIIVIAIALIVGLYYYQQSGDKSETEAFQRLVEAKTNAANGNFQVARLSLRDIADNFSGDAVGAEALYMLASINYASKDYDAARSAYQEYADEYNKPRITHAGALAGIAACMENNGEYSEASKKFVAAWEFYPDGPAAGDYAIGALRTALMAGETEIANSLHEKITKDFWRKPEALEADQMMTEIKPTSIAGS